jgi:hypothetical protein
MRVRIFAGANHELLERDINIWLDEDIVVRHVLQSQDGGDGDWTTITVFYDDVTLPASGER